MKEQEAIKKWDVAELENIKRVLMQNECRFRYKGQRFRVDPPEPDYFRAVYLISNDNSESKEAYLLKLDNEFARGNYYYLRLSVYICGQHLHPTIELKYVRDIEIINK